MPRIVVSTDSCNLLIAARCEACQREYNCSMVVCGSGSSDRLFGANEDAADKARTDLRGRIHSLWENRGFRAHVCPNCGYIQSWCRADYRQRMGRYFGWPATVLWLLVGVTLFFAGSSWAVRSAVHRWDLLLILWLSIVGVPLFLLHSRFHRRLVRHLSDMTASAGHPECSLPKWMAPIRHSVDLACRAAEQSISGAIRLFLGKIPPWLPQQHRSPPEGCFDTSWHRGPAPEYFLSPEQAKRFVATQVAAAAMEHETSIARGHRWQDWVNQGLRLAELGRKADSEEAFARALRLAPPGAHESIERTRSQTH